MNHQGNLPFYRSKEWIPSTIESNYPRTALHRKGCPLSSCYRYPMQRRRGNERRTVENGGQTRTNSFLCTTSRHCQRFSVAFDFFTKMTPPLPRQQLSTLAVSY
eukprot:scaffold4107_cov224-Skeletonema_marinoi.AAC.4